MLHVFGRTRGTPPIYYYRRLVDHKDWTPWEKVQADIEGDHLIPAVFNRRLYLFWPIFREVTDHDQDPPRRESAGSRPEKRLEIKLAWSEYKNGVWSAKTVSTVALTTAYVPREQLNTFYFRITGSGDVLQISCFRHAQAWKLTTLFPNTSQSIFLSSDRSQPPAPLWNAIIQLVERKLIALNSLFLSIQLQSLNPLRPMIGGATRFSNWQALLQSRVPIFLSELYRPPEYTRIFLAVGVFALTGCDREATAFGENIIYLDTSTPIRPTQSVVEAQGFKVESPAFEVVSSDGARRLVLGSADGGSIPTPSYALPPSQYSPYVLQAPFVYHIQQRTYLVTPEQVADGAAQVRSRRLVRVPLLARLRRAARSHKWAEQMPHDNFTLARIGTAIDQTPLLHDSTQADASQKSAVGFIDKRLAQHLADWSNTAICPSDRADDHSDPLPASLKLRFHTFYHPYVCEFVKALKRRGVPGLLALCDQRRNAGDAAFRGYDPQPFVDQRYPKEEVDFEGGAYAGYNWELFFHAPLLIATRLSANQRFEEAQRWFHFIFDPTSASSEPIPQRYWKTLRFNRNDRAPHEQIGELLDLLSYQGPDLDKQQRKAQVEDQIAKWRDDPFSPHHIARMRITAYQKTVVMKYIDNLIAWGDQLFRQDTIEAINQATQLYVLAHLMLGKRPAAIPPTKKPEPKSYAQLRPQLDSFSNALVATENTLAQRRCMSATPQRSKGAISRASLGVAYFCVPQNDKLLGYWNTVEDRLFKIRHCMNIEGVVRQLPLFEPPIDPALLVRARAAGLDLGRVLNDINAARPHYRFAYMLQKALELCNELRGLGAALLAAHEKRDAEDLALLRSSNEIRLLEQVKLVREKQVEEAEEAIRGLEKSKEVVQTRRDYYRDIEQLTPGEAVQLTLSALLMVTQGLELIPILAASPAHNVPDVTVGVSGIAGSPVATIRYGGSNVGSGLEAFSKAMGVAASMLGTGSSMAGMLAGYERRWDEQCRTHQAQQTQALAK